MSVGHDLLDVPFPEMISKLGLAIAQSQFNLDKNSIEILKIMGNKELAPVYVPSVKLASEVGDTVGDGVSFEVTKDDENTASETEIKTSMIGAGFQPTFYQFAETIIEVKMAITMSYESQYEKTTKGTEVTTTTNRARWWAYPTSTVVKSTPVDAKYSSKYNYTAEGSSLLRTRLVPMPPNSFMQRILDMKAQAMQMAMELKLKQAELAMEVEKAKIAAEVSKLEEQAKEKIDT
jgi:hypothetical protein